VGARRRWPGRETGEDEVNQAGLLPPDEIAAKLCSAVLSDVLDSMGLMTQAMRPFARPLDDGLALWQRGDSYQLGELLGRRQALEACEARTLIAPLERIARQSGA
jgi:hypothetical protein